MAFPTAGSPWAMTPEPSVDSFSDGFTNNAAGGALENNGSNTFCEPSSTGRIGAWFKNQDHAGSNQTCACRIRLDSSGVQSFLGPSCRHNEGALNDAVDYLIVALNKTAADAKNIIYAQRTNGAYSGEGSSNDAWNLAAYYEMKLSVTGTGVAGTTMYGWLGGVALNTASVSNVTAGDDTELSSGIGGFTDDTGIEVRADDWWAEAFSAGEVKEITGIAEAQSTVTGTIEVTRKIIGTITTQSSVAGTLEVVRSLTGTAAGQLTVSGTIEVSRKVSSTVTGQSAITGDIEVSRKVSGTITPQSSVTGSMSVLWGITGTITAQSVASGTLRGIVLIIGAVTTQSSVSGFLLVVGGFSDVTENKILDHITGKVPFAKPTAYVGFCTADPGEEATGANCNEVPNTNGYGRIATAPGDWNSASSGSVDNANVFATPEATGPWGTITHYVLVDSPAHGAGNILIYDKLDDPKVVDEGDNIEFAAGELSLVLS